MKKFLTLMSLLICLTILLTGCGGSFKPAGSKAGGTTNEKTEENNEDTNTAETESVLDKDTNEPAASESSDEDTEVKVPGKFTCISDISDYWNKLYKSNEEAINAYSGMETIDLVSPGMCFISGVQYDILNIYNVDGHFEGELMLAGYQGFEDKKGSQVTFGYEDILEEDGFGSYSLKGDKKIENGNCDLDSGYYFSDSYTDRSGEVISRSTSEFQLQSDKSMSTIVMDGNTLNYSGEEQLTTSYIFMRMGDGTLEYAVAKSETGTDYDLIHLEDNMTKEMAIDLFEAAGAVLDHSGGIKDGKFVLD
jgi:hypothetical protein